jgi:hypothetical protein
MNVRYSAGRDDIKLPSVAAVSTKSFPAR